MIYIKKPSVFVLMLCLIIGHGYFVLAQTAPKEPKHFFKTTVFSDVYYKPDVTVVSKNFLGDKLKTYGITQSNLSFYTPLYTSNTYNTDSTVNKNFHLLFTLNLTYIKPHFSGISQHLLSRNSIGLRGIYNAGKKSIFFFDVAPFITKDVTYKTESARRNVSTFVWSYSPDDFFNFRLGYVKSFLWGNRLRLPFIGMRFGKIDKTNFSIQFPRSITFNVPANKWLRFSLYTKPQGGMFNFSNHDTLYLKTSEKVLYFGRYEFLLGIRADVKIADWFCMYVSGGYSAANFFAFYSPSYNSGNNSGYGNFFQNKPAGTYFINAGLVFRFGRVKSYYNNRNIYEAIHLNNTMGSGDTNINPGDNNIPYPSKKTNSAKTADILDLIDINDF